MSQHFISSVCFQSFAVCELGCMSVLFDRGLPSLSVSVCFSMCYLMGFGILLCFNLCFLSVSVCFIWRGFAFFFVCFSLCFLTGLCLELCLFQYVSFDRVLPSSLSVSVCVVDVWHSSLSVSVCAFCLFHSVLFDRVWPSSLSVLICVIWQGFALIFCLFPICVSLQCVWCDPSGFKERPEDFAKVLFIARITQWSEGSKMPRGWGIFAGTCTFVTGHNCFLCERDIVETGCESFSYFHYFHEIYTVR